MQQILTGRIGGSGDSLTLTLRLHEKGEDVPFWSESFSGKTNQVVELEQRVLIRMPDVLGVKMTETEHQKIDLLLTNNLEALEWCRKGSGYARSFSDARLTSAKEAYYRALALDPNYCDAHAGVIYVNRVWFWSRSSKESWPDVLDRARMILKIDDTHYMARYWLVCSKCDHDWDWEAAIREEVAFLQEPPVNHATLALFYREIGRMDKARFHQAEFDAQPSVTGPEFWCSFTGKYVDALYDEMVQGRRGKGEDPRFDAVVAGGRRIQQLEPENHVGYQIEAMGHLGKHDYAAVIDATRRGRMLYETQELHALAGYAYARMGDEQHANNILRELERLPYPQPYFTARIHAALGNREQALAWLEKAYEDRSEFLVKPDFGYGALRLDEAWDDLRSESRFLELLRKTGLDKWPK